MSKAVLDAGPLIHLAELNALDVLGDFEILYLPAVVWDEVVKHQPNFAKQKILRFEVIESLSLNSRLATFSKTFSLDLGEIQSLAIMENYSDALFLTDDSAARLVAEEFGYRVHGTIGLLIRAVRKRLRSPKEILDILKNLKKKSSLHIRSSLLKDIIRRLEIEWQNK